MLLPFVLQLSPLRFLKNMSIGMIIKNISIGMMIKNISIGMIITYVWLWIQLKENRTEFNEGLYLRVFRLKINTIIVNEKTTIFFRNVCVKSYADNIHHAFVKYFEKQKSTYSLFLHKEIYRRTNSFFFTSFKTCSLLS